MTDSKHKPSGSDARRIYLRGGNKKNLKVTAKTLDDALKPTPAKATGATSRKAPWTTGREIVALSVKQAAGAQADVKRARATKILKPLKMSSKLPKLAPKLAPLKKSSKPVASPKRKTASSSLTSTTAKVKTKKSAADYLPYTAQPRFEGSFHILQGGLPGQNRRK